MLIILMIILARMAHPCPVHPLAVINSPSQLSLIYTLSMLFYSMNYLFGHFGSAVLVMLPHSFFVYLLTPRAGEIKKSLF